MAPPAGHQYVRGPDPHAATIADVGTAIKAAVDVYIAIDVHIPVDVAVDVDVPVDVQSRFTFRFTLTLRLILPPPRCTPPAARAAADVTRQNDLDRRNPPSAERAGICKGFGLGGKEGHQRRDQGRPREVVFFSYRFFLR